MSLEHVRTCILLGKALPLAAAMAIGLTGCGGGAADVSSSDPPAVFMASDPPDPPQVLSFSDPTDPPPAVTTSRGDPLTPVPEPSSAWLLLSGAGALAVFRRSSGRRGRARAATTAE